MTPKQSLSKSDIKKVCDILRRDDGVGAKNYVEQLSWLLFLKVFENVEGELKELAEAEGKKYQVIIDPEYQWSTWAKKDWKDKDELVYFVNQKLFPYLKNLKGSKEKDKIGEVFRELSGNLIRSAHNLLDIIDILDQIEMKHFQDTHLLSQVYEEILQEMGSEGGWAGEFYTPRPIIRLMIKIVNPKIGETIFDPFVGSGGFLVESFDYLQKQVKNIGVNEWDVLQNKTFSGQEKTPLPYLIGTMNMMLHRILVPNLTRSNTFMEDIHNIAESSKKQIILTNPPFGGKEHQSVQNNFPIPVGATEGLALQYVMKRLKNGGRCGIVLPELNILFGSGAMQNIRQELLEKFNVHSIISLPAGTFAQMGASVKTILVFFDKTGSTKNIWYGEVGGKFTKKKKIKDENLEDIYEKWKKREVSDNSWIVSVDDIKKDGYDLSPKNPLLKNSRALLSTENLFDEIKNKNKEVNELLDLVKGVLNSLKSFSNKKEDKRDWETVEFGEVLDYEQPTNYIVEKVDYDDKYSIPVLTAGKTFVLGYTNEKTGIFQDKLPVIIFDDFTTATKFVDFPFKVKSSAMKILYSDKNNIDIKYLFYAMQQIVFPVTKHKRYWISEYSKIKIQLPSFPEQKRIVCELEKIFNLFQKLDNNFVQQSEFVLSLRKSLLNNFFQIEI